MKLMCVLIMSCCLSTLAQAAPLFSLSAATQSSPRAGEFTVELIVLNPDSQPLSYDPPSELAGMLQTQDPKQDRRWVVTLHSAQPVSPLTIQAGQFVSTPYVLTLPGDAIGAMALDVSQVAGVRLALDIKDTDANAAPASTSLIDTLKQQEAQAPPVASRIERTFANRFGFHDPIYFIYGAEAPAAKFQFSFKYRLIGENSKFGASVPPFRGLYFAYTQRSLWDLDADSSPFYDTSYMPELFFEWLAPDDKKTDGWFHVLGLQTGIRHESNGKAGDESRSLNIGYLRTGVVFGSLNGWQLIVAPRVFSYIGTSRENADIRRYRGNGELQLSLAKNDNFQLSIASRIGQRGDKGSIQVDLTQPVRIPLINLETYLQLQYFDGYGESLRTYNQKSSVWRLGLGFVR